MLVLGFFEYFARQFQWNQHVVSVTSSGPVHKVCDFASVPHFFLRTRSACLLSRLRCMPWCPPAVGSWTRSRTHKKTCIDAFVVCAGVQADVSFHQGQNTCICIQDPLDLVRLRALYACVAHALCAAAVSATSTRLSSPDHYRRPCPCSFFQQHDNCARSVGQNTFVRLLEEFERAFSLDYDALLQETRAGATRSGGGQQQLDARRKREQHAAKRKLKNAERAAQRRGMGSEAAVRSDGAEASVAEREMLVAQEHFAELSPARLQNEQQARRGSAHWQHNSLKQQHDPFAQPRGRGQAVAMGTEDGCEREDAPAERNRRHSPLGEQVLETEQERRRQRALRFDAPCTQVPQQHTAPDSEVGVGGSHGNALECQQQGVGRSKSDTVALRGRGRARGDSGGRAGAGGGAGILPVSEIEARRRRERELRFSQPPATVGVHGGADA